MTDGLLQGPQLVKNKIQSGLRAHVSGVHLGLPHVSPTGRVRESV